MRTHATQTIRTLLRAHPDGLDVGTIANALDREPGAIRARLKVMPDVYIDRWEKTRRNYIAIWCIVTPPNNCPRPTE